jgi:hypothetical protein
LLLQPNTDFIIVDKFSPVGLRDAFPDGGAEAVSFLYHSQSRVFHKMLRVHPGMGRDTGKLGFLLRREMYFHAPNVRVLIFCVNSQAKPKLPFRLCAGHRLALMNQFSVGTCSA